MTIKKYKPYTSTMRNRSILDFSNLTKIKPEKSLVIANHRAKGRNNEGKITVRHKGGGHKRCYRLIDFKRNIFKISGVVSSIEYDPNRNCNIALIKYKNGIKKYILNIEGLKIGQKIESGNYENINIGNCLPLEHIPLGTEIHNIELIPNKGGQICRSAGTSAKILAKENKFIIIRLASKEIRLFNKKCLATIGKIDNADFSNIKLGKAGRNRWLGIRPTTRGSAMNAIDHPHGGGEGRCPIGKPSPLTPWGKLALGKKTRKKNKKSNKFIIKSSLK
jgi:large subunit ribosomal protein L2